MSRLLEEASGRRLVYNKRPDFRHMMSNDVVLGPRPAGATAAGSQILAESTGAAFYGVPACLVISMLAAGVRTHLDPGGAVYVFLSGDVDIPQIEQIFREHDFSVSRVLTTRWLLRETMVILCAR